MLVGQNIFDNLQKDLLIFYIQSLGELTCPNNPIKCHLIRLLLTSFYWYPIHTSGQVSRCDCCLLCLGWSAGDSSSAHQTKHDDGNLATIIWIKWIIWGNLISLECLRNYFPMSRVRGEAITCITEAWWPQPARGRPGAGDWSHKCYRYSDQAVTIHDKTLPPHIS